MQISISGYTVLKPGTTGRYCPGGRPCTPVTFVRCDNVHVWIRGDGLRSRWHLGFHAGLLQTLFSWDIAKDLVLTVKITIPGCCIPETDFRDLLERLEETVGIVVLDIEVVDHKEETK